MELGKRWDEEDEARNLKKCSAIDAQNKSYEVEQKLNRTYSVGIHRGS